MTNATTPTIAKELNIEAAHVQAVVDLLAEGATIPFVARYRKEATGSLDEVAITAIRDRLVQLTELADRKLSILKSLEKNGHLNDDLKAKVMDAPTMAALEDIYLPYRPKRRTRAAVAKEKGLEPLARLILEQRNVEFDPIAAGYIDPDKGVATASEALSGARDIIAELINEQDVARARLRQLFFDKAMIRSTVVDGAEATGAKFKDYFQWEEKAADTPSHRMMAMRRGEKEDVLNLSISPPEDEAIAILESLFVKGSGPDSEQVGMALKDAYKRLLSRAMETEMRLATKDRSEIEAIRIFSKNLRELLLAPPLGAKRVMGIDPGYRSGCKLVCLDRQGKLLHHDTIYPHTSAKKAKEAGDLVKQLCDRYAIEAVAVGNGTAGRETENFLKQLQLTPPVPVVLVNESGASIYSASAVAREEFPDLDLTVRGAISIGRRLMDPLSELVKIDPKSIGVGQYQHDVDQNALKRALDDVVVSCVNGVGVDLNRASVQLLSYVSGLGPQLARNIVAYRDEHGPYPSRNALKQVSRLGPKAYEQSAGFLRIPNGENPLDASAVHPESYHIVDAMARDLDSHISDLMNKPELRQQIDLRDYVTDKIGLPTLNDILEELAKPGRDPRKNFETVDFASDVVSISDLKAGMNLPGVVTNVTAFGAFVDIGVHQDGLVHVSQLSDRFVKNPADVVKVQQKVQVRVLEVDLERNRISLSMRRLPGDKKPETRRKPKSKTIHRQSAPRKKPFHNPFADALKKRL